MRFILNLSTLQTPTFQPAAALRSTILLGILLALTASLAWGQTGFEDSEGKSSIVILEGGTGKINVTDKSIKIGYLYRQSPGVLRFGAEVFGKASEGRGVVFSSGTFQPEAGFNLSLGFDLNDIDLRDVPRLDSTNVEDFKKKLEKQLAKRKIYNWITFRVGYKRAQYDLFRPGSKAPDQIEKQAFNGYSGAVHYNAMICQGDCLFGLSFGVDGKNNISTFKDVEVFEEVDFSTNADTTRLVRRTKKAKRQDKEAYKETAAFLINMDLAYIPSKLGNRIGFNFFARFDTGKEDAELLRPGLGIFITEDKAPSRIIGGASLEFGSFRFDKPRVGLVAGFKF